jgi:hypothetical protein
MLQIDSSVSAGMMTAASKPACDVYNLIDLLERKKAILATTAENGKATTKRWIQWD